MHPALPNAVMPKATDERRDLPRGPAKPLKDALYSTLRLIAKHIKGFYGALAAFVTVSLVVGVAAVAVFGAVASLVTEGFTQSFDERVLTSLQARRTPV